MDREQELRAQLRGDTLGKRVAGWFLIANAALSIVAVFAPEKMASPLSIGLDLLVGFVLLRGYGSAANVALFRIVLATFFAIIAAVNGNPDPIIFTIPYGTGLALLLIGNPGKPRFVVGCVFFSLYLTVFAGTVALLITGKV